MQINTFSGSHQDLLAGVYYITYVIEVFALVLAYFPFSRFEISLKFLLVVRASLIAKPFTVFVVHTTKS